MLVIEPDVSYAIECVTAVSQLCADIDSWYE